MVMKAHPILWVPLLAAVLAGVVAAQSAPPPATEVVGRIAREAASGSRLMDTARILTDIYGPRLTGSPHLKSAAEFVVNRLKDWDIATARLERWGPYGPGWTTDRFMALALSPVPYPLIAYPKAWTPGTEGAIVANAAMAVIRSEQDFDMYRGRLKGMIVLTAPGAGVEPAFARKRMQFFIDEGVVALLEPGGADGAVVVGDGRLADDPAFAGQGFYPWPDAVVCQVVVATEQYNRIARTLEQGIPVTLELDIANSYHPAEPDSFNIVADLAGTDLASEVVMLGAHFDSWHGGTGAADNAAGNAVLLEAMRILRAAGLRPRRTIRLALWTGSEQGNLGARAYVTQNFADPADMVLRPDHARLSAYFNLDRGAGPIRGVSLQGNVAAAATLRGWLAPLADRGAATVSPQSTRDGDHRAFDAVGLPAFEFIQDPGEFERIRHTNLDTFERLDESTLIHNAIVAATLAYQAANSPALVPRKPVPEPDKDAAGPWSPGR